MSDKLKLTILVNNNPVYFGAPVFYSQKKDGEGVTLIIQTEIGTTTKQNIEIQLKNPNYVEPITVPGSGDTTLTSDAESDRSE